MRIRLKGKLSLAAISALLLSVSVIAVRCSREEFGVTAHTGDGSMPAEQVADDGDIERYVALERGRGDGNLLSGNDVRLLIDGPETYAAMFEAIAAARQTIHVETYIFQDDTVGQRFADALIASSNAGVQVRVMYDGYGSTDNNDFWQRLREAGVQIHEYNPPEPTENADVLNYDRRDHRKVMIVDGKTGFIGGVNFYDAYASGSLRRKEGGLRGVLPWLGSSGGKRSWRDTHIRIEGPAVAELQRIFVTLWEQEESRIEDDTLYPQLESAGRERIRFNIGVGGNKSPSETYTSYLDVFREARRRIWITQAYFVPNEPFLDAMSQAARRGVDVKVIVPGVTDVKFILYASRDLYGDLLEAGVRIFEYKDAVLHAKTAVADGSWSIVGSSNLDALSVLRNNEVDAVVIGADFAREMERQYMTDLEHTREITLEEWRHRPLGYRVLGVAAGWFKPWL